MLEKIFSYLWNLILLTIWFVSLLKNDFSFVNANPLMVFILCLCLLYKDDFLICRAFKDINL